MIPEDDHTSLIKRIRNNLYVLELIELFILGFGFAGLVNIVTWDGNIFAALLIQVMIPLGLGVLWLGYMLYIVIARNTGKVVDIFMWVVLAITTSSFTFWYWSILDINRLMIAKFFYTGHVPVEFAWSFKSKARRKVWDKLNKESQQTLLSRA